MKAFVLAVGVIGAALAFAEPAASQQQASPGGTSLDYIGHRPPLLFSPAVKAGKLLYLSGAPGIDKTGKVADGDFASQMKQAMDNLTDVLKASGAGWDRVAKVTVMLVRNQDFGEMNKIYATYFPSGNYPARTTVVVSSLALPAFLIEIDCEAVLE